MFCFILFYISTFTDSSANIKQRLLTKLNKENIIILTIIARST